jgi:hypothetical protein
MSIIIIGLIVAFILITIISLGLGVAAPNIQGKLTGAYFFGRLVSLLLLIAAIYVFILGHWIIGLILLFLAWTA